MGPNKNHGGRCRRRWKLKIYRSGLKRFMQMISDSKRELLILLGLSSGDQSSCCPMVGRETLVSDRAYPNYTTITITQFTEDAHVVQHPVTKHSFNRNMKKYADLLDQISNPNVEVFSARAPDPSCPGGCDCNFSACSSSSIMCCVTHHDSWAHHIYGFPHPQCVFRQSSWQTEWILPVRDSTNSVCTTYPGSSLLHTLEGRCATVRHGPMHKRRQSGNGNAAQNSGNGVRAASVTPFPYGSHEIRRSGVVSSDWMRCRVSRLLFFTSVAKVMRPEGCFAATPGKHGSNGSPFGAIASLHAGVCHRQEKSRDQRNPRLGSHSSSIEEQKKSSEKDYTALQRIKDYLTTSKEGSALHHGMQSVLGNVITFFRDEIYEPYVLNADRGFSVYSSQELKSWTDRMIAKYQLARAKESNKVHRGGDMVRVDLDEEIDLEDDALESNSNRIVKHVQTTLDASYSVDFMKYHLQRFIIPGVIDAVLNSKLDDVNHWLDPMALEMLSKYTKMGRRENRPHVYLITDLSDPVGLRHQREFFINHDFSLVSRSSTAPGAPRASISDRKITITMKVDRNCYPDSILSWKLTQPFQLVQALSDHPE